MPLSSINTGLQQTPDLTDIQSVGKLSFQFISIYNAISILQQAIDTYTGNTPAAADGSNQNATPEQTVLVGNNCAMWCTASANLSAGFLVNLFNVSGQTQARYANATVLTQQAHGITLNAASAGQPIHILLLGLFNFGGSVTPGQMYYLSTTPGGLSTTPPAVGSSELVQPVGFGVDTNSIFFNPSTYTEPA